jgi:hypothetical protein
VAKFVAKTNFPAHLYQYCDSLCGLSFENAFISVGFAPSLNQNRKIWLANLFGGLSLNLTQACGR